jgi:hypothetical protein
VTQSDDKIDKTRGSEGHPLVRVDYRKDSFVSNTRLQRDVKIGEGQCCSRKFGRVEFLKAEESTDRTLYHHPEEISFY